jgi:hypothetical protein
MAEVDRQLSDRDQTSSATHPGRYIPLENVDRSQYDIIHPGHALARLQMTERTAYRRIDSGELEYTLERGAKRLVVKKDQTLSDPPDRQLSVIRPTTPDTTSDDDRPPVSHWQTLSEQQADEIRHLRQQLEDIRNLLEAERIKNARTEGELQGVPVLRELIETQRETIDTQKMANEALNNERLVVTQQLQKYRSEPTAPPPPGLFGWFRKK